MSPRAGLFVLCGLSFPTTAFGQGVSIDHQAVGCVLAGKFPRFDARLDPAEAVARARVNFRPEGTAHWYSVEMKPEAGVFHGILPKPLKTLHRFSYYIDVTDRAFHANRTAEFVLDVASGPAACGREKVLGAGLSKANVLLQGPEGVAGAPAVPAGFSADGVATATTAGTGAAVGGAGAAAAGGIGATALVIGGAVATGAAVAVVAATKGDDTPPTTLPPPTATGRWSGALIENDARGQCTANWNIAMDLVESGGSLAGPMTVTGVSSTTGIYQCAGPGTVLGPNPISDGTIAGTAVHWTFTFVFAQQSQRWSLDGVIAQDRRSMSGTWVWLDLTWEDNGTWTATRQ